MADAQHLHFTLQCLSHCYLALVFHGANTEFNQRRCPGGLGLRAGVAVTDINKGLLEEGLGFWLAHLERSPSVSSWPW
jgi:hypothetical protein